LTYDLGNRLLSITDLLNNVVRFGYDRVGNRTSAEDARGHVTDFRVRPQ
jgi:YD repeat-containing protein